MKPIPRDNEEGRVDFNSLCVTFASLLAHENVPLVQAQQLMRHCDPRLTANVTPKFTLHDQHQAIEALPLGGLETVPVSEPGQRQDDAQRCTYGGQSGPRRVATNGCSTRVRFGGAFSPASYTASPSLKSPRPTEEGLPRQRT